MLCDNCKGIFHGLLGEPVECPMTSTFFVHWDNYLRPWLYSPEGLIESTKEDCFFCLELYHILNREYYVEFTPERVACYLVRPPRDKLQDSKTDGIHAFRNVRIQFCIWFHVKSPAELLARFEVELQQGKTSSKLTESI
jgi:hypothetical protein